ncbi:RNB domain-containing ribonuclease, partial [Staphylococcus saprophyticus]|uniref:RNB domain-containing ribonuclease n=1 Tax=Staphylococcus saprophyticus TaxID=29385 RepID=UPI003704B9A0
MIPIIPPRLSSRLCSLNPQVNPLTLTSQIQIHQPPHLLHHQIFHTLIHSNYPITYHQVNQIITHQHTQTPNQYTQLTPILHLP